MSLMPMKGVVYGRFVKREHKQCEVFQLSRAPDDIVCNYVLAHILENILDRGS